MHRVTYNRETDILTVDTMPFSGAFFDSLLRAGPGTWLRVEERGDSTIVVYQANEEAARAFDAITGRGPHRKDHG